MQLKSTSNYDESSFIFILISSNCLYNFARCSSLGSRCPVLDAGYWMLDAGYSELGIGSGIQNPVSSI
jgi:hypothetical protein